MKNFASPPAAAAKPRVDPRGSRLMARHPYSAACPPLATEQDHRNLVGRKVLIAHERSKTIEAGWYLGKVKLFGVSGAWNLSELIVCGLRLRSHAEGAENAMGTWLPQWQKLLAQRAPRKAKLP